MNLDSYTLYELMYRPDLIEEAYTEELCWNGEDRDFCDSKQWDYINYNITQEIDYRLSLVRWD